MNEFDKWRLRYNSMSYQDQVSYHNDLAARYPEQNHYNYANVKEALQLMEGGVVLEFGTWKGDLAKQALQDFLITTWYGVEICETAISQTKCPQVKYIKPDRFDWFSQPREIEADIIIATHFIEHLSNEHFKQLAKHCVGVKLIHFEAPLTNEGNDWKDYEGTHKLTIGWDEINKTMQNLSYKLIINHPESKTYQYEG